MQHGWQVHDFGFTKIMKPNHGTQQHFATFSLAKVRDLMNILNRSLKQTTS
jgi:hypothetical protein